MALFIATAITFTAENATVESTITVVNAAVGNVYTRGTDLSSGAVPAEVALIDKPDFWPSTNTTVGVQPSWSPILNNAVAVAVPGDVALVDARGLGTGSVLITFTLVNAAALDGSHNYFILPVELKVWRESDTSWQPARTANGDGLPLTGGTAFGTQYLSTTNGYLTFTVDGDGTYGVFVPTGGSIYATNTTQLAPTFLISTTPA